MNVGRMVPVVDVSIYQGVIDFDVMASHGVKGVIIRVANGNVFDKMFGVNCPRAQAAGLEVGGYTFVNPKNASGAVAGNLLASVHNDHGLSLPPMLDVEGYTREFGTLPYITGAPYAAWIREMAAVVEAGARRPIFYCNASYWNPIVRDATFGGYDCIVARYPFYSPSACAGNVPPTDSTRWADWIMAATSSRPQVPSGWDTWDGWQFSAGFNGRARIYGASAGSDLDLNIVKDDAWARWTGTHTPDIPTPVPVPKPQPAPAPAPDPPHGPFPRQAVRKDDYDMKYILQAPGRPSTVLINGVAIPAGSPDDLAGFATGTYESINTTTAMFDRTIAAYAPPA